MNEQLRQQLDLARDGLQHVPEHKRRGCLVSLFNLFLKPGGLDVALAELDYLTDD